MSSSPSSPGASITESLDLHTFRRRAMAHALAHPFDLTDLRDAERGQQFFRRIRQMVEFAGWCALEHNDASGPFAGDAQLLEHVLPLLEAAAPEFMDRGTVGGGDANTAYFTLVPATEALRATVGLVDATRHQRLVEQCAKLFDDGLKHINGKARQ